MTILQRFLKVASYFLVINMIISSCRKDENHVYNNFISYEIKVAWPAATINTLINSAVSDYPELIDLEQYVTYDVNVYKIIYSTTVGGEGIYASGLVCVPAAEGEYPVLSFQNGTNTRNAVAPSEYPINPSYQLIEFMASMGFIVVIPDYPGFGESAQIPHPYLLAEPTIQSVVDMLRAVKESCSQEFSGIVAKNEYYLMGYSQGGWATLAIHKAIELDYASEFNLAGSVCGAGPYNMQNLVIGMLDSTTYSMPSYLGYIINAYSAYHYFTNPVTDLLKEPYASRLASLYTGTLSLSQINSQLTTKIADLFTSDFLSGFAYSSAYSTVRAALINNSIDAWNSAKPLLFVHGTGDRDVSVTATETMYDAMINAGTSSETCKKILFPGLDHGEGIVPCMTSGLLYLLNIRDQ
jgi:pimeloyl-ACP methyl ester carboxylesterase